MRYHAGVMLYVGLVLAVSAVTASVVLRIALRWTWGHVYLTLPQWYAIGALVGWVLGMLATFLWKPFRRWFVW